MARIALRSGIDPLSDDDTPTDIVARRTKAQREFEELQAEYRSYAHDYSPFGKSKRAELARKIKAFDVERAFGPPEMVDVTVPADSQGFSFWIGGKEYPPGVHRVPGDVAQVLLHMIDSNRRSERRILQSRGRDVDLGAISERARAAEVLADD